MFSFNIKYIAYMFNENMFIVFIWLFYNDRRKNTHTYTPPHTHTSHTVYFCLAFNSCQKYYLIKSISQFLSEVMHFTLVVAFIIIFEKMYIHLLCPVLNWVIFLLFSSRCSLYILDTSPLSDT